MNAFYAGSLIKLQGIFKSSGTLTDPTTVRLLYKTPASVVTVKLTTQLQNSSVGVYYYNVSTSSTEAGIWRYRYEGTGICQAAYEGSFEILSVGVST